MIEAQQVALKLGAPFEPMTIVHDAAMIKAHALIDDMFDAEREHGCLVAPASLGPTD